MPLIFRFFLFVFLLMASFWFPCFFCLGKTFLSSLIMRRDSTPFPQPMTLLSGSFCFGDGPFFHRLHKIFCQVIRRVRLTLSPPQASFGWVFSTFSFGSLREALTLRFSPVFYFLLFPLFFPVFSKVLGFLPNRLGPLCVLFPKLFFFFLPITLTGSSSFFLTLFFSTEQVNFFLCRHLFIQRIPAPVNFFLSWPVFPAPFFAQPLVAQTPTEFHSPVTRSGCSCLTQSFFFLHEAKVDFFVVPPWCLSLLEARFFGACPPFLVLELVRVFFFLAFF